MLVANGLFSPFFGPFYGPFYGPFFGRKIMLLNRPPGTLI